MAIPENLEIASSQDETLTPVAENKIYNQVGEIAVEATAAMIEVTSVEHHRKVQNPHQMTRLRARFAGRRLLF